MGSSPVEFGINPFSTFRIFDQIFKTLLLYISVPTKMIYFESLLLDILATICSSPIEWYRYIFDFFDILSSIRTIVGPYICSRQNYFENPFFHLVLTLGWNFASVPAPIKFKIFQRFSYFLTRSLNHKSSFGCTPLPTFIKCNRFPLHSGIFSHLPEVIHCKLLLSIVIAFNRTLI